MDEARAKAEEEAKRRESPEAALERLRSRTSYQDATFTQAVDVARLKHPGVMEGAAWTPLRLRDGYELVRYIGDDQAEIRKEGQQGQTRVQSMLPLRTENEQGELAATDLRLEDRGNAFEPVNPLVDLRLPKRLVDGISLAGADLGIETPDAAGGDGALVDGKAFWANVATDTDFLAMPLPAGVETFWQLRSHDSPQELRMTMRLPAGATLRPREGLKVAGALTLVNDDALDVVKDGKVVATIGPPHTSDADGQPVPTSMTSEGERLTITVDHRARDVAYPLMVDPIVTVSNPGYWPSFHSWHWYTAAPAQWWDLWMWSYTHWGYPHYPARANECEEDASCNGGFGRGVYVGHNDDRSVPGGDWGHWVFFAGHAGEIDIPWAELVSFYTHEKNTGYVVNNQGLMTWGSGWADYVSRDWRGWETISYASRAGQLATALVDQLYTVHTATATKRASFVNSAYIVVEDAWAPRNITPNHSGPAGWVDDVPVRTTISGTDTGVGVKQLGVEVPEGVVASHTHGCRGDRHQWCPATWSTTLDYPTRDIPEGSHDMRAFASDAWGNDDLTSAWRVKVDHSPPEITPSGPLADAHQKIVRAQPYRLHVKATEGSGSGAAARSGVKEVEIKVDGVTKAKRTPASCPEDSCGLEFDWEFDGADYAEGKHKITILARDRLHGAQGSPESRHVQTHHIDVTVKHAASAEVGPGTVDLRNGSIAVGAEDVSIASFGSSLALTRTYDSYKPAAKRNGIFGPGWTSSVAVDEAGADYSGLAEEPDGTVTITFADSTAVAYSKAGTGYTAPEGFEDLKLAAGAVTNTFTLSDPDGNVTTFGARTADPGVTGRSLYAPVEVRQQGVGKTLFSYEPVNGVLRPTRAIAPSPAGVDCSGTLQPGCRVLTFVYAPVTTANGVTSTQSGDFRDRLMRVDFTAYDPANGEMKTDAVARYAYDSLGLLRAAWDPRVTPELKTTYDYDGGNDGNNRLTAITPPGQSTWGIAYSDALPDDPNNTWRVKNVSRATPQGMATWTISYRVPVSGGAAPYQMSSSDVDDWGQAQAPATATAIFPPDNVPGPTPSSYSAAEIHYLDVDGREVNLASPGGRVNTTEYDAHDNVVRELSAENRRRVLAGEGSASTLDTQRKFSDDGLRMLWELGPRHKVRLGSGQVAAARKRTDVSYDEGAPAGGPYHLPTTTKVSAQLDDGSRVDARETKQTYDWTLRKETSNTTDPAGLSLKRTTAYNAAGLVTESRRPSGRTGEPRTRRRPSTTRRARTPRTVRAAASRTGRISPARRGRRRSRPPTSRRFRRRPTRTTA